MQNYVQQGKTLTTKKPIFDATKPFVVPILSGGEKLCEVRYPSDEEW